MYKSQILFAFTIIFNNFLLSMEAPTLPSSDIQSDNVAISWVKNDQNKSLSGIVVEPNGNISGQYFKFNPQKTSESQIILKKMNDTYDTLLILKEEVPLDKLKHILDEYKGKNINWKALGKILPIFSTYTPSGTTKNLGLIIKENSIDKIRLKEKKPQENLTHQLPPELWGMILPFLINSASARQAIDSIKNLAKLNSSIAKLLQDKQLLNSLADKIVEKFSPTSLGATGLNKTDVLFLLGDPKAKRRYESILKKAKKENNGRFAVEEAAGRGRKPLIDFLNDNGIDTQAIMTKLVSEATEAMEHEGQTVGDLNVILNITEDFPLWK